MKWRILLKTYIVETITSALYLGTLKPKYKYVFFNNYSQNYINFCKIIEKKLPMPYRFLKILPMSNP